ncbi:MAG: TIGR02147 family protein [Bdellovibrionales bacterium]
MNIYKHLNYRRAFEELINARRQLPGRFTLRALAEKCGLQASFLTNVLKGRGDFSADQLFAIATELGCSSRDRDYLLLLLEHERSVYKPRREELRKRIEDVRKENQKSEKHLAVKAVDLSRELQAQYYLDPFAQLTLVYLNLSPYQKQPEKLGAVLGISQEHLGEILKLLVSIGYVQREGSTYKVTARDQHLPKSNPLSVPHLILMRMKSMDQLQRLSRAQAYSHSVTFTGTEETRDLLSDAYLTFLKKAESIVRPANSEKVFQMNFDLFPWAY